MNILNTTAISLFLFGLGGGFVFLGIVALKSPQKIVDYQFKRYRPVKYFEKIGFMQKMYKSQIIKAENGYYAKNWRRSGFVLIFMGLMYIYALISYFI